MSISNPFIRSTRLLAFTVAAIVPLMSSWAKATESNEETSGLKVHYLGVSRADVASVRDKVAQVAPSPANVGRLNVTDVAVAFFARAPKQLGRFVPVVVFGHNRSLKVSFERDGKLMLVEGDGRVWLFFNDGGFNPDDRRRIQTALGPPP